MNAKALLSALTPCVIVLFSVSAAPPPKTPSPEFLALGR